MTINDKWVLIASGFVVFIWADMSQAFSWAPVNPDELKMTSEPKAPGAPAIILEKQIDRDETIGRTTAYIRFKILTEEGRKLGDVELPYVKDRELISDIEARTVSPDGKITDLNDKIYDKLIIKSHDVKYQAKTFTMPNVQVGSIVEYRFIVTPGIHSYFFYFNSQFILSDKLFTRHAKYSLRSAADLKLSMVWPRGLPPGTKGPTEKMGVITVETFNVAAFNEEDFMPPAEELKYRVDLVYYNAKLASAATEKDSNIYWNKYGSLILEGMPQRDWLHFGFKGADSFMAFENVMLRTVTPIISGAVSDEDKLRRIYAYVQQLRNLDYERVKTDKEEKREKLKSREDVSDVVKYGYGDSYDLTLLYIALARAAGFKAQLALSATRDRYFFQPDSRNPHQLLSRIAIVSLNGRDVCFQPGKPYVPFGMLPWYETGVAALRLDKQGSNWIKTPLVASSLSEESRKANLKLADGVLKGTIIVTHTGLAALDRRSDEINEDDATKKEYAENELKRKLVGGSEITLTNEPDWKGVGTPLVFEYTVTVPGWVSSAGKRLLMPIGLMGAEEKHIFDQEKREHPIYFHYPITTSDDINIEVPANLNVAALPKSRDENIQVATFSSDVSQSNNVIHLRRDININGVFIPDKYYLALRDFYQSIRTNDEEQVVLTPATNAASKSAVNAR